MSFRRVVQCDECGRQSDVDRSLLLHEEVPPAGWWRLVQHGQPHAKLPVDRTFCSLTCVQAALAKQ
jgi:hypothetical protein